MNESGLTNNEARSILLEQKKVQDAIAGMGQYAPSVFYVLAAIAYTTLMFMVRESALLSVWIAFSIQLLLVWLVFGLRSMLIRRKQRIYEAIMLRKPSDSFSTVEMLWGDRVAELRQHINNDILAFAFGIAEPLLWLGYYAAVYFLVHNGIGIAP